MTQLLEWLYRIVIAASSVSLFVAVFLIKDKTYLTGSSGILASPKFEFLRTWPDWTSCVIYIAAILIISLIGLLISYFLENGKMPSGTIVAVETSSDGFVTNYLAYFFVALGTPSYESDPITFWFVFSLIFVFIAVSKVALFNPVYFVFGFRPYKVTSDKGTISTVVSRKQVRNSQQLEFKMLKKLNENTYLDLGAVE